MPSLSLQGELRGSLSGLFGRRPPCPNNQMEDRYPELLRSITGKIFLDISWPDFSYTWTYPDLIFLEAK